MNSQSYDSFGNAIDLDVGYARGSILDGSASELARMHHGRSLVSQRFARDGKESIFDLTGVPRAFPIQVDDVVNLTSQLSFYAYFEGKVQPLALRYMGGNPHDHDVLLTNRLSSGMFAAMLTLLTPGNRVIASVPGGRSHPCIPKSVKIANCHYSEALGIEATLAALKHPTAPTMVVITTVSPQHHCYQQDELGKIIHRSKELGALVILDDAHAVTRMALDDQLPPLELGPVDVAITSTDKHMMGPRCGIIGGRIEMVKQISATVHDFGLETQFPMYVAVVRALENYDPNLAKETKQIADSLLIDFRERYGKHRVYSAGAGIAISDAHTTELVRERSMDYSRAIVPAEVVSAVAMMLLANHGLCTVQAIGMPGMFPITRIMTFPDGIRAANRLILDSFDNSLYKVAEMARTPSSLSKLILGN